MRELLLLGTLVLAVCTAEGSVARHRVRDKTEEAFHKNSGGGRNNVDDDTVMNVVAEKVHKIGMPVHCDNGNCSKPNDGGQDPNKPKRSRSSISPVYPPISFGINQGPPQNMYGMEPPPTMSAPTSQYGMGSPPSMSSLPPFQSRHSRRGFRYTPTRSMRRVNPFHSSYKYGRSWRSRSIPHSCKSKFTRRNFGSMSTRSRELMSPMDSDQSLRKSGASKTMKASKLPRCRTKTQRQQH